jgi:hypothetical protein
MITLKLLLWLLWIATDCWINYTIIEKNDSRPNYLLMNIVRGCVFILYGAFIWDTQADLRTFYIFLYCTTSFSIFFDLALNISRGKHLLYIGQTSGWINQWGFKNPFLYYIFKVLALAGLVFSIVKIYQG